MSVEIKITGDDAVSVVKDLADLLGQFIAKVETSPAPSPETSPEPPKTTRKKRRTKAEMEADAKAEVEAKDVENKADEPEENKEPSPADDLTVAIGILMPMFSKANKEDKKRIMALAKKYDAKKFGEIEDKHGTDLLADATALRAELNQDG